MAWVQRALVLAAGGYGMLCCCSAASAADDTSVSHQVINVGGKMSKYQRSRGRSSWPPLGDVLFTDVAKLANAGNKIGLTLCVYLRACTSSTTTAQLLSQIRAAAGCPTLGPTLAPSRGCGCGCFAAKPASAPALAHGEGGTRVQLRVGCGAAVMRRDDVSLPRER